ncbi:MAG: DUF4493 domain-containing protein [Bacteroidales bacterium]|nr:DUF4493 domain-containing protein [Bacteroidales bacterium]
MMKAFNIILPGLIAAVLASCSKDPGAAGPGVHFRISSDPAITDAVKSDLSSYTDIPDASLFTITISHDGKAIWSGLLPDWKPRTKLPSDTCLVTAVYTSSAEGPGMPNLYGEKKFYVSGFDTTVVEINASLSNCIVKMDYTENFLNYFKSYTSVITTGAGNSFTFDKDHDTPVFIDAYRFSCSCTMVNQGGSTFQAGPVQYSDLKAGTCYTLKLDASNVGSLDPEIIITFDEHIDTVDLGILDIN